MLEQLQTTGTSSEASIASVKKGGKTGKAGVFANLFSALTHNKGKLAKGQMTATIGAEKHISLRSALAAKSDKNAKLQATKHASANIGKTEHGKKTKSLQALQTPLAATSAQKKKGQEETPAAIVLPVVSTANTIKNDKSAKEEQPHQTSSDKKDMRNTDKRDTHADKLLTLANKNETTAPSAKQSPAPSTTAMQQEIGNSPLSGGQNKHISAARPNENIRTENTANPATQAYEKPAVASLHSGIEQQISLQQNHLDSDKLKGNKLQTGQTMKANKYQQDAQTNITQQALLAARSQANNVKSGSTTSASASSGSANHAALVNLLNQNAAQLADQQQGNSQFGHGQSNNHLPDSAVRQEMNDARFSSLLQSESRTSRSASDAIQQRFVHAGYPLKALEAMRHIAQSAKDGATRLELQLEPAHLGKIHVSLQTDAAKQLQMHLTVEQAMTRQVIEQHLPHLRTALEQQGLSLDQFSLQTGSQQQHAAQDQSFSGQPNQQQQANDKSNAPAQAEIPINTQAATHGRLSIHI